MKHAICIMLLVFIQFAVKAQTEKGRWSAGVSVGQFTYQHSGNYFSGSLSPTAGYFAASNFMIGAGVPVSYNTQGFVNSSSTQKTRSFGIGISPFARYYVGTSKLKPTVGLSVSFSRNTNLSLTSLGGASPLESVTTTNALILTPSVGLAYFLNQTISLDARLGYNWARSIYKDGSMMGDGLAYAYENVTLGIGFNVFFGE